MRVTVPLLCLLKIDLRSVIHIQNSLAEEAGEATAQLCIEVMLAHTFLTAERKERNPLSLELLPGFPSRDHATLSNLIQVDGALLVICLLTSHRSVVCMVWKREVPRAATFLKILIKQTYLRGSCYLGVSYRVNCLRKITDSSEIVNSFLQAACSCFR